MRLRRFMLAARFLILALVLLAWPLGALAADTPEAFLLRSSADLSADATLNVQTPSFSAAMVRVRVANASGFSAQVKVQIASPGDSVAKLLCTLATVTTNGDYLFALGADPGGASGVCSTMPTEWQLFLDHSAGSADVAVELYPIGQATANTRRLQIPFGAIAGATNGQCLVTLPWANTAAAACTSGTYAQTLAVFHSTAPPRLSKVVCTTTGGHIGLDGGEEVRVQWIWLQPNGSGSFASTVGASFLSFGDADDQAGDFVVAEPNEVSPYAGTVMLQLRVDHAGGTITTTGSLLCRAYLVA
jgi:hypothetical protein